MMAERGTSSVTVSVCLSGSLPNGTKRRHNPASLGSVKAYLDEILGSPQVGPAEVCRDLGISRQTLYQTFTGHGGVASYIQNQRLAQAYALLVDQSSPYNHARDIVASCGFATAAHFHRCFRQAIGVTLGNLLGGRPKKALARILAEVEGRK